MFSYKVPIAIVTASAFLQPPIVIAQDIAEVNNIARNISVKITGYGNGSGFILERQGNIYSVVTNKHVVPIDTEYEIQTHDGTKHQVAGRREIPDLDLAIIQFESTEEYEVAELGDSDELEQRQFISVAGFPGEETNLEIIDGQVRRIRQEIITDPQQENGYALVYTNQTLPGSSGGAVLDEDGRVVAINGEASIDNKTGRDISRGIPINTFLEAEEKLFATENNLTNASENNDNDYQLAYTTDVGFDWVFGVAISGNKIVSGDNSNIKVRNLATGELERTLTGHSDWVFSVAISDNKIISGSYDKTIRVWNLDTGELERTLTGHSGSVKSVAINANKIVSGGDDKAIKVWNLATGELERTLTGHSSSVSSVAISGDKIVSGSSDQTIKVWNLATGELEQTLSGHSSSVSSVAISGDKIVSGSLDSMIKVWNLVTGELERTLNGRSDSIRSVAISGDKIVSGSLDEVIEVWNLTTGELEQTLTDHSDEVYSVAISGDKIVSGSLDSTIKMWQLPK